MRIVSENDNARARTVGSSALLESRSPTVRARPNERVASQPVNAARDDVAALANMVSRHQRVARALDQMESDALAPDAKRMKSRKDDCVGGEERGRKIIMRLLGALHLIRRLPPSPAPLQPPPPVRESLGEAPASPNGINIQKTRESFHLRTYPLVSNHRPPSGSCFTCLLALPAVASRRVPSSILIFD